MSLPAVLTLYNLLLPIGLLLSLPGHLMKMVRRGNYGTNFMQRFGRFRPEVRERLRGGCDFWIHAVSVGEVLIARKLIEEIERRDGALRVVLSTTTSTGYALARAMENERLTAIYNPLDFRGVVKRVLAHVKPRLLVLVEAEVWPNLVSRAKVARIPVYLVNARLSDRSEARYKRFRAFAGPIFEQLDGVFVQSEEDEARWEGLGVPMNKIGRMGSIKFDVAGRGRTRERAFGDILEYFEDGGAGRRPVFLAGSTHPGEEGLLAAAYLKLRETHPRLLYVVVPRHVERTRVVMEDLSAVGLSGVRRTELEGWGERRDNGFNGKANCCLVVDTTGELRDWYREADLVVIGKSFLATGGQNPVEAIIAGKPVFLGPHMENFSWLVERLVKARAVEQVTGAEELELRAEPYLRNPKEALAMSERAETVLAEHVGATKRTVDRLVVVLSGREFSP
ncbi:MAG: 3-deoxy-D-manno-octulosonic acid transferase [Verrucomicrobiota bacterium]